MFHKTFERLGTNATKWDRYGMEEIIALGTADLDFPSPPAVTEALVTRALTGMFGYELKSHGYYEAIIDWHKTAMNWTIRREAILNAPGIWLAMRLAIETYSERGAAVLVQAPTFHPLTTIIEASERHVVTTGNVLDWDDVEQKLQRVQLFILIHPHNPTGRVLSADELRRLAQLCQRYGVLVITDEVYGNLTAPHLSFTPFATIEPRAITITAASKTFNLQGLTYALVIIDDDELRARYESALRGYDLDFAVNVFSLAAVEAAYRGGRVWLEELRHHIARQLDIVEQLLDAAIIVHRAEAGYFAWLDYRALGISDREFEQRCLTEAKVALTWGSSFGVTGFARLNVGCSEATLRRGLARLNDVFRK